jgi:hypothetical protein
LFNQNPRSSEISLTENTRIKLLRFGEYELQFNTRAGNDAQLRLTAKHSDVLSNFIPNNTGAPDSGKRLVIAQIDDESLDFYSTQE